MNAILETECEDKTEFKFCELSKAAQRRAVEKFAEGEPSYDWWDGTYEDAGNIGLEIQSFDIDYRPTAKGKFTQDETNVAKAIIAQHGKDCGTFKTAIKFQSQIVLMADEQMHDENGEQTEDYAELCEQFLKDILDSYARMLKDEWEYLSSYETAEETLKANDHYEFDEDGNLL